MVFNFSILINLFYFLFKKKLMNYASFMCVISLPAQVFALLNLISNFVILLWLPLHVCIQLRSSSANYNYALS